MLNKLKFIVNKAGIYTLFLAGVLSWNIFLAAEDGLSEDETIFLEAFQAQVNVQDQLASGQVAMEGQIGSPGSYGYVLEDNVNVRTGPGLDFSIAGRLYRNEEIKLLEELPSGWWKIDYAGRSCYVSSEFIAAASFNGLD